jgi:hypothetical protein
MKLPKGVILSHATLVFYQESDSCSEDTGQELTVGTDSAGDGNFIWIKTKRWAADNPEDVSTLMKMVLEIVDKYEPTDSKANKRSADRTSQSISKD